MKPAASPVASPPNWLPSVSIRTLLTSLVIATALPLLLLAFVSNLRLINREQQATRDALMTQMKSLAALVDNAIDTHMAVTATLATSQLLMNNDLADFKTRARSALVILPGDWLTVTDPDGHILLTTADNTPPPTTTLILPVTTRAWSMRSVQISDVVTDPVTGSKAAFIVFPVITNGVPAYTLYLSLAPTRFQNLITDQNAGTETIGIVDRQQQFIARLPTPYVGAKASPGWRDAMAQTATGFSENKTLEGTPSVTAYAQTRYGWTVGRSVSVESLNAPMWNTISSMALLSIALLAVGLLIASLIAKQMTRVMLELAKSAQDVGLGHTVEHITFTVTEATDISDVLSRSSKSLAARQAALIESEAQFRGTFENAAVGIAHVSPDGKWLKVNRRLCEILNCRTDELIGKSYADAVTAADRTVSAAALGEIRSGERLAHEVEVRFRHKDGFPVWVATTLGLRRGLDGEPKYIIVVVRDITERRAAQDHQKFLLGELAHRSKNQLAVIQAIANQTTRASKTLAEFRQNFSQRLNAMAVSTDLLIAENWTGVPLRSLVDSMVQPFITHTTQLVCDGPTVIVSADAAQAIGLALHELGTNCVKHGAWSQASGTVTISWKVETVISDQERPGTLLNGSLIEPKSIHVVLSWTERDGPPVSPPTHSGFGQVVIEQMVAQKVGGTVELAYNLEGFRWQLTLPEDHVRTLNEARVPSLSRTASVASQQPSAS